MSDPVKTMVDHVVLAHGDLTLTWWSYGDDGGVQLKDRDAIDLDDQALAWLHDATGQILQAKSGF